MTTGSLLVLIWIAVLGLTLAAGLMVGTLVWALARWRKRTLASSPSHKTAATPTRLQAARAAAVAVAIAAYTTEQRRMASPMARAQKPGTIPSRWVAVGRSRQVEPWRPRS